MKFREMLSLSGLTMIGLSKKMGVHIESVYRWKDRPPKYVVSYLEERIVRRRLEEEISALKAEDTT